jgi:hypothetical protein
VTTSRRTTGAQTQGPPPTTSATLARAAAPSSRRVPRCRRRLAASWSTRGWERPRAASRPGSSAASPGIVAEPVSSRVAAPRTMTRRLQRPQHLELAELLLPHLHCCRYFQSEIPLLLASSESHRRRLQALVLGYLQQGGDTNPILGLLV